MRKLKMFCLVMILSIVGVVGACAATNTIYSDESYSVNAGGLYL